MKGLFKLPTLKDKGKGPEVTRSVSSKDKGKGPAPGDTVRHTRDALLALPSSRDPALKEKAAEEAARGINDIMVCLYGDAETFPSDDLVARTTKEIFAGDFVRVLITATPHLSFDSRRDAAQVYAGIQRQKINNRPAGAEFLIDNSDLLHILVEGYRDQNIALFYGSMLRDSTRHQAVAKHVLESGDFERFFEFVELPNFDVSSDAAATFRELLTRHKATVGEYLTGHYDWFFERFKRLLLSPNYVTRRMAVKLLADLLHVRENAGAAKRYLSDTDNLRLTMNLMKDQSKSIQLEAFHVFKLMVTNPEMPPDVASILLHNRDKLTSFLVAFTLNKEEKHFDEDKAAVMAAIRALAAPPS